MPPTGSLPAQAEQPIRAANSGTVQRCAEQVCLELVQLGQFDCGVGDGDLDAVSAGQLVGHVRAPLDQGGQFTGVRAQSSPLVIAGCLLAGSGPGARRAVA
jgi:hypothetical protein